MCIVIVAAVIVVIITIALVVLEIRAHGRTALAARGRWAMRRRSFRVVGAWGLVLWSLVAGARIVTGGGPVAFVPTWVLIAGMPWFPPEMILEDPDRSEETDWALSRRYLLPWDRELARWRARGIIMSECSAFQLHYAMRFLQKADIDVLASRELNMVRGVAEPDPKTRYIAAMTPMGPFFDATWPSLGQRVLPYRAGLAAALDDPIREVRGLAAWYLSELGEGAAEFAPKMLKNLAIGNGSFNIHLADMTPYAVARLAIESDDVWRQLLEASRSPDQELRWQTTFVLWEPKLAAKGATDRLLEMLRETNRDGIGASYALSRSLDRPEESLAAIIYFIETRWPRDDRPIFDLHKYGARWWPYLGRLLPLLQSEDQWVRRSVLSLIEDFPRERSAMLDEALEALRLLAERSLGPDSDAALKLYYKILYPQGFY